MKAIIQISVMARQVYAMYEKLKAKNAVSDAETRTVLYMYEDVMEDVHVSIALPWKKARAPENAANMQKVIEVLTSALK